MAACLIGELLPGRNVYSELFVDAQYGYLWDVPGSPCFIKVQFLSTAESLIVERISARFELTYRAVSPPEESNVHP